MPDASEGHERPRKPTPLGISRRQLVKRGENGAKSWIFESKSGSGWYSFNFRAIRELVQAPFNGENTCRA